MYPEDRVLVGVINRARDLERAQHAHWYRVPLGKAEQGIHSEYVAFYLSRAFGERNGGIHVYARRTGLELVRRRDLLPDEPDHPRAEARYYKLQLGELRRKDPPVLNPTHRAVAFIYTTWDRFEHAEVLADLYSPSDEFVDRVFHALERRGVRAERVWGPESGVGLRIACRDGWLLTGPEGFGGAALALDTDLAPGALRATVEQILSAMRARGGPLPRRPAALLKE